MRTPLPRILILLSGKSSTRRPDEAAPLEEPLSDSELRVLRYLPTNLPDASSPHAGRQIIRSL
jgi:hypothetical protein